MNGKIAWPFATERNEFNEQLSVKADGGLWRNEVKNVLCCAVLCSYCTLHVRIEGINN